MDSIWEGKLEVTSGGDDDFIGFALGFNLGDATVGANPDPGDFLSLDWKQGSQNQGFGCQRTDGNAGLALSQVYGIPIPDEFWGHVDFANPGTVVVDSKAPSTNFPNIPGTECPVNGSGSSGVAEMARTGSLDTVGWADNTEYDVRIEALDGSLKVFVDTMLQITYSDTSSFEDGGFAFTTFRRGKLNTAAGRARLCRPRKSFASERAAASAAFKTPT